MANGRVALNFLPLSTQQFELAVFRRAFSEGETRKELPECRKRKLPVAHGGSEYRDWWVSPEPFSDAELFETNSAANHLVALDVLRHALGRRLEEVFDRSELIVEEGIRGRIAIVVEEHAEGSEAIWLRPYYLRMGGVLGFLLDYWFKTPPDTRATKRILQLSLTLDARGRRNKDFYIDRFRKITDFLEHTLPTIAPLDVAGTGLQVQRELHTLPLAYLPRSDFLFGGNKSADGPFVGLQKHGPVKRPADPVQILFLYRHRDRPLSQDLFRALRGDTFSTFRGMGPVFGVDLDRTPVAGAVVEDYTPDGVAPALRQIGEAATQGPVVPVLLVPFRASDRDPEATRAYFTLKHTLLTAGFASQFVSLHQLQNRNELKWSLSNIALQLFAKMGGHPWKVATSDHESLIVGLGQSTRPAESGGVDRFLAYSVLTDSSGIYRELRFLGKSRDEGDYRRQLRGQLARLFREYGERYRRFVVHASFSIGRRELSALEAAIRDAGGEHAFFVLRFNEHTDYFAWDQQSNSMVPFQGAVCELSRDERLVWFDGVNPERPKVLDKTSRPVQVKFTHPHRDELDESTRGDLLADSLHLGGANWRGFNARSLPVSIAYAKLVAKFLKGFDDAGLEEPADLPAVPWFL